MTRILLLLLALCSPAAAQYVIPLELPPETVIGNPLTVNAPAQAIPWATLISDLNGTLLTTTSLPSTVDLTNLPPQTVVGNSALSAAPLGFITFSQLKAFESEILPDTSYVNYDPTNMPTLTVAGNAGGVSGPALPISLGTVLFGGGTGCTSNLLLNYGVTCTLMARMTGN